MVFLQITASVTFLPLLNDRCSFDLLVYTDVQSAVPMEWSAPLSPFACLYCSKLTEVLHRILSAASALRALLRHDLALCI